MGLLLSLGSNFMKILTVIAFVLAIPLTSFGQINLQSGLVACYTFSGNAKDGSGNNNDGTIFGAKTTMDRFSKTNAAYEFDGVNDHISIPVGQLLNDTYSYSAWIKLADNPSSDQSWNIISIGDNTSKHQTLNVANSYSSANFVGLNAGGYNIGSPPTTSAQSGILPVLNQWYHLVSVRSATQISLYVNGSLIGSSSTNNNLPYYGSPAFANIGTRCNLIQFFKGIIDDVVIYNRALTGPEVLKLFTDGVPCSPIVTIEAKDQTRCGNGTVTITASGATNYRWYNAAIGGNLLFEGNPFITPVLSIPTSYYVAGIVNSVETATRKKVTATVFQNPGIICHIPATANTKELKNYTVDLVSVQPPATLYFDFGDNTNISTGQNSSTHGYDKPGTYIVSMGVKDVNGCTSTCSSTIVVEDIIPVPEGNNVSVCGNESVTLTASGGTAYKWYDSETSGALLFAGNPFITPILSKTTAFYVANVVNQVESPRLKITVAVSPVPVLTCDLDPVALLGTPQVFMANVSSGSAPYRYTFDFGDQTIISTNNNTQTHIFARPGVYTIQIVVKDLMGCEAFYFSSVEIENQEIFIPNIITPNNDNFNEVFTLYVKASDGYQVYPGKDGFGMKIFNRFGEEIFSSAVASSGWHARDVSAGSYFYNISLGERVFKGWIQVVY
jgi:hypothetical protein